MEPTQARYNTEVKLAGCAFSKEGSAFAGWSTRPGGPVQYTDGQTVKTSPLRRAAW